MEDSTLFNDSCNKYRPEKQFNHVQEIIDNLPYILMILLGAAISLVGFNASGWGIAAAVVYTIYGCMGVLWIIYFVCPYCHFFDTRLCPCGYGQIAARFRKKSPENKFAEKFKKHIPVIVPLWIIPILQAIIFLKSDFSHLLMVLTVAFCINSFIILPLVARIYGCGHCQQKNDCPWMVKQRPQTAFLEKSPIT